MNGLVFSKHQQPRQRKPLLARLPILPPPAKFAEKFQILGTVEWMVRLQGRHAVAVGLETVHVQIVERVTG